MATTSNKRSELVIYCNAKQAEAELKKWREQLKQNKKELRQMAEAGKSDTEEFRKLNKEIKNLSKSIKANESDLHRIDNTLKDLSNASLRQVERAARDAKKALSHMSQNDPNLKTMQGNLQKLNAQIQKLKGNTMAATSGMVSVWKKAAMAVTSYFGVTAVIGKLVHLFSQLKAELFEFSDQMANIRKVSGLAYSEITKLTTNLAKLDTRTTIQELNNIAYAGAKLGIGKWGTEALEGFVKAANKVNVALKEDMGQEALTALAKMTEVMGLIPKMGVEKSMLATGSAIFQLGATSTANASNIVEFSKRLMGMSRVAGITVDQLLAIGSASDSMGLMPEVSATAFNKLISALQKNHNLIEKELAIEPGTINQLYSAGKAMDAMVLIFEKMKEKGNMNALGSVFKPLGSEGARLVNVMVTMANRVDMLKEHLYTSQTAFEEASAVTNEYNIQQETAAALMERASNAWNKAFVNSEGVDAIKTMAQGWYDFSMAMSTSTIYMGSARLALNGIYLLIRGILLVLPLLINYMLMRGVVAAITGVVSIFGKLITAVRTATVAQTALNTATKLNPWALLATVILTAVSALIAYKDKADEVAESQRTVNDFLVEAARTFERESRALANFVKVANDATLSTENRRRIIAKFNHEYGSYLSKLGIEVKDAKQLKDAYAKVNEELKKKMYYQMRDRAYDEILGNESDNQTKALLKYSELTNVRMPELRAFDTKWLQERINKGKGTRNIFLEMMQTQYGKDNVFWDEKSQSVWQRGNFTLSNGMKTNARNLMGSDGGNDLYWTIDAAIKSVRAYNHKKRTIDNAFNPIIGDYVPWVDESPGTLDNDAPDKAELAQARRDRMAQQKAWREELKQAQDEARAVMDNIKNFYQRQITEVLKTANEKGWDKTLLQSATDAIVARQNLALSQARKGIAGIKSNWEEFKGSMKDDMVETANDVGYNESQVLLDMITSNNLTALHDKMNGLSKNLGLPANAATDAIWKNATMNEKANETAIQRRLRERQKKLLEDNYTAKVDDQYSNSMTQLGYFDVNVAQSKTLVNGGDEAQALLDRRAADIEKVFKTVRERITDLVSIGDVSTADGKNKLLSILLGPDWQSSPTELRELLNLEGEDMQLFYNELMKYSDDYTEALKKAHDRQKKLLDFQWKRSEAFKSNDDAQKRVSQISSGVAQFHRDNQTNVNGDNAEVKSDLPIKGVYGGDAYMDSFSYDPEVEAYRLKMEAAAAYYDFLKAHGADAQTLRDAEQSILQSEMDYAKSVAEQMKNRMDDVYGLAEPIEDFGSSMGEAFATMTEDAEAGRAAVQAAIGDMIKAFMKQTVQMTQEYIKRRIMQKTNDRLTSVRIKQSTKKEVALENAKQDEILDTQKVGGQAQEMLNTEVKGNIQKATAEIGQQTLQTQQQQTQTEVQTESAKTQANTTMGIASGASKIIGSLGWWGIPLVAVITALLNGLLSFAMSKVTSLFGGGTDSSSDAGATTKLVSGMLTYDSGNVQAFRGIEDGKSYPVVGDDGKVYAATDGGELSTGLVKDPITTFVNGQPALVAERGPEMVIGRETTAAMMMARPDILAEIVKFDRARSGRTFRAFDEGNIDDYQINLSQGMSTEEMSQLRTTIDSLASVLADIQQKGIPAHINKYGRGGVAEAAKSGGNFMQRNSGDRLWQK